MKQETYEERKERENKIVAGFQALMAKVPQFLEGWTWTNRDERPLNEDGYLIDNGDGKIWCRIDTWHKRITISSLYPNSYYGTIKQIGITISPSKTPEQIAKDIKGRFLPAYLQNLHIVQEQIRRDKEYKANVKATMRKVADYLGIEIHENGNLYTRQEMKEVYSIEPHGEDGVKFTVECSADKAIKVFEALKQEHDPETDLRTLWNKQGVPKEKQDEIIQEVEKKAQPGATVGPFVVGDSTR